MGEMLICCIMPFELPKENEDCTMARKSILQVRLFFVLMLASVMLAGCTVEDLNALQGMTTESVLEPTVPALAQVPTAEPTATPVLSPTAPTPNTLRIWWPEPLAPLQNSDAADLLSEQISGFQTAQGNVVVDLRMKSGQDILSTLRVASPVAPGVLPDLTLIRRSDLLLAVQDNLVYPIQDNVSTLVLSDTYDVGVRLGLVDGVRYGLPYVLDVEHMAYQPQNDGADLSWRFSAVLENKLSFVFPAVQSNSINRTFLTQYIEAGGEFLNATESYYDPEALATVLSFYESAVNDGLIDSAVLSYTRVGDYVGDLAQKAINAGVINSTHFLRLLDEGENLAYGYVPTQSGQPIGAVDGWMWVVTTANTDRQALALRFLNWMHNAERHGRYTRTIQMLPAQRGALQYWENTAYMEFVRELLVNGILPLSDSEGGNTARILQGALVAVLNKERSAEEALQDVRNQLGSG